MCVALSQPFPFALHLNGVGGRDSAGGVMVCMAMEPDDSVDCVPLLLPDALE